LPVGLIQSFAGTDCNKGELLAAAVISPRFADTMAEWSGFLTLSHIINQIERSFLSCICLRLRGCIDEAETWR